MPKYTFQKVNTQQCDNAIWADPKSGSKRQLWLKKREKTGYWIEKREKKQEKYYNEKVGYLQRKQESDRFGLKAGVSCLKRET